MLFFSAIASANALLPNYMPQAGEQELNNCLQQKCIGIIGICKKNLLKSLYSEVGKTQIGCCRLTAHFHPPPK
jgi:hypothetical protein